MDHARWRQFHSDKCMQDTCRECKKGLTSLNRSYYCDHCHNRFEIAVFFIGLIGGAVLALIIKWGLSL